MFVHWQDCKSPHQLPLARELVRRLGSSEFVYLYRDGEHAARKALGWNMAASDEPWMRWMGADEHWRELVENADVLLTGFRDVALFEERARRGLTTFYCSERWFKPILLPGLGRLALPGWIRLLFPRYWKMARRLACLASSSPSFHVLPMGVHAWRDMRRIGVPKDRMTTWGYFVSPTAAPTSVRLRTNAGNRPLKVLWVGRMLDLKRVDVIIRAIAGEPIQLDVFGDGVMRRKLKDLAEGLDNVNFYNSVPIAQVRELMRSHDVYVLASNQCEGWGAVVNEALEEGMIVLGTRESGAGATILRKEFQFSAGDVQELRNLLRDVAQGRLQPQGIGEWSAEQGAKRLLKLVEKFRGSERKISFDGHSEDLSA